MRKESNRLQNLNRWCDGAGVTTIQFITLFTGKDTIETFSARYLFYLSNRT